MSVYALKKLAAAVPVLLGVSVLVFLILHLTPGDPARIVAGPEAPEADVQLIRQQLGLDQPLPVQYWRFISRIVQGDFGKSLRSGRPVADEIGARFPFTLELAAVSLFVSMAIGLMAGIAAATRRNTVYDGLSMGGALLGVSMPSFWLGLMMMLIFSYYLRWLPASGRGGPLWTLLGWQHVLLPAVSLGATSAGTLARLTRSSMLEVLRQDFVRTARAKGLAERVVVYRHALRAALIPIVTIIGLRLGFLLGGSVITETVFAWPGIGTLTVNAIAARDFPVVQASVLLIAVVFVAINMAVDLLYGFIDPRIRFD